MSVLGIIFIVVGCIVGWVIGAAITNSLLSDMTMGVADEEYTIIFWPVMLPFLLLICLYEWVRFG